MLQSFLNMIGTMVSEWAAKTAVMTSIKQAFGIESVATDNASSLASIAAAKAEAAGEIPAYAATGASAAMASVAAIPFVGWAMAPAVGAEHFAMAMGYLSVASAAGGWEVPSDQLAMVHEKEKILPARYTAGLDAMVENAASGGTASGGDTHVHFNVTALDGDGVKKFFRNNRSALSAQIKTSVRDHGLRMPK